jgi:actin-binding protein anillin
LNQYRYESAEKRKSEATTPRIVVRHSRIEYPLESTSESDSAAGAAPPKPAMREKDIKKRLQELVNQEQSVIMQTSNALNQCCGINSTFAGSAEAVECHRLLLMACELLAGFNTLLSWFSVL